MTADVQRELAEALVTANEDLIRELAKVISDPGSVLSRHYYRPGERETQEQWAARAVLASLPAVQREDPGWLYNEASGVLYGPDPDHPGLRYPFVTNVEAVIGHRLAEAMNRAALASPAPAPQGEEPTCYCGRLGHRLGGPILHKRTEECPR